MSTSIRFQISKPSLVGREREYVLDAVDSGWISSNGPYLQKFQDLFAQFVGVEEPIAVCNGTVALHVACMAMGLEAGQEVIVPAMTYVATGNAVTYCGARPVFADSDPISWNVTAATIEAALTPQTVGVIIVHLYGLPADMEEIAALCRDRGLWLIEDCAESLGSTYRGKASGTFGDAATFSFYGNKTISTGEGGMVVVRDPARRYHSWLLRGQGMDPARRYWHPIVGYNYRLTNIAAAIGLAQLEDAAYHIGERRRIAATYIEALAGLEEQGRIRLPARMPDRESSFWLFALKIERCTLEQREAVQQILAEQGIETRPFFVPLHQLPMYQRQDSYPVAEQLGAQGLCLPAYSGLADDDVRFISGALSAAIGQILS